MEEEGNTEVDDRRSAMNRIGRPARERRAEIYVLCQGRVATVAFNCDKRHSSLAA